jgi:RNA polymerase sigma-70 factor (ECF subfamily)
LTDKSAQASQAAVDSQGAKLMASRDQTDMGGPKDTFLTTHWSLIDEIKKGADQDQSLIGSLLGRYWKPVYCYLRRKGYDNDQAKDLTQGFFHEVVLNRNLVQRAEQSKGRFRTFLLHALNHYVINVKRKQTVQTRIPKDRMIPLDAVDPSALPQTLSEASPEDSYNYTWLSALLDQTLSELRVECRNEGLDLHWQVFYDRVVGPTLHDAAAPSLADVCREYGIGDEKKAANMTVTIKRRFQKILKRHVRSTVISDADVDDELREIMRFLPESAQPF